MLDVLLPRDRSHPGELRVAEDGQLLAVFPVLGRGSRGPGSTWHLANGNTPTGDYDGRFETPSGWPRHSYGRWGVVRLVPVSGNALMAQSVFGRTGLLIHAGGLNAQGGLRPTYGCLRVGESDMLRLRRIIEQRQHDDAAGRCQTVELHVLVREY